MTHLHFSRQLSPFLQIGTVPESPGGIQGETVLAPCLQRFMVAALGRNIKFRHGREVLQSGAQPPRR